MKIPRLWAAIGAGLAIGTLTAFAQPAPHTGVILPMIVEIESALNLNAAQKAQFDAANAVTNQAFAAAHARHEQITAAVDAEMAKARPDFAALSTYQDAEMEVARTAHLAVRGEWLKLYALLNDSQAAVVKTFLQERMMRVDTLRENIESRMKGKWG